MRAETEKQAAVLGFVRRQIERTGHSPSVREIAAAIGVSSTCTAQRHLQALETKGLLTRVSGQRGRWRLADALDPWAELRAENERLRLRVMELETSLIQNGRGRPE